MKTQVTTISTEIIGDSVTIHTVQNSAVASITVPAAAAAALARLLTAGSADTISAPGWQTPAEIKVARGEKAAA